MSKGNLQKFPHQVPAKQTVEYRVERSGPLPAPTELAGYNAVIPGGAERILKMAEGQSAHRMEIEKAVINSQQSQAVRGQYFGLFAVTISVACATFAAVSGAQTFAAVLGGSTVLGLASAFLGGKYLQKKDLSEKAKASPEPPAK